MLQLGFWRTIVDYFRRWNTYHDLAAEGEATYSIANANGNADEQYVVISIMDFERLCHSKKSISNMKSVSNCLILCVYFVLGLL